MSEQYGNCQNCGEGEQIEDEVCEECNKIDKTNEVPNLICPIHGIESVQMHDNWGSCLICNNNNYNHPSHPEYTEY